MHACQAVRLFLHSFSKKDKQFCLVQAKTCFLEADVVILMMYALKTVKATPHKDCAEDALPDFSADRIEIPQAYYRMSRDFCAR